MVLSDHMADLLSSLAQMEMLQERMSDAEARATEATARAATAERSVEERVRLLVTKVLRPRPHPFQLAKSHACAPLQLRKRSGQGS